MTLETKNSIGNFFEDFSINQKIEHATPRTITHGDASVYTSLYGTRFALHSSNVKTIFSASTISSSLGE